MTDSMHKKVLRLRPPTVNITYGAGTAGASGIRELPFVVAILADLRGGRADAANGDGLNARTMIDIDRDNFNEVLRAIAPRVAFSAAAAQAGDSTLAFRSIDDFEPRQIIKALPSLSRLHDAHDPALDGALSAILHSAAFRTLEATWRGLHHLVFNTETSPMLRLRVLDIGKEELRQDLLQAAQIGQSLLFRTINEDDLPCSVLIGDHGIDGGRADMALLQRIAALAASLHAPFVAQATPGLLGLDSFATPDQLADRERLRDWRAFRDSEDARWVHLVLPRALLRPPCGLAGEEHGLWGNPAYLLARCITQAFALYRWPAAIRGVDGGGLIETPAGQQATDVVIGEQRAQELIELGFIPLCDCQGTGQAAFFYGETSRQAKKHTFAEGNVQAHQAAMLPCLLAAARFAHYIKAIMRARTGSVLSRASVEGELEDWLASYVLLDDNATQEVRAAHPLRAAKVMVADVPDEPGALCATLFVQPQFQLDEFGVSIRLVMRLPG